MIIVNSTTILFLNMLKADIKRHIYEKQGLTYSSVNQNEVNGVLSGQTISKSEIENLTSMKLMNDVEKNIVYSLLESMSNKPKESSNTRDKQLVKHIDGVMPYMYSPSEELTEFKDAA